MACSPSNNSTSHIYRCNSSVSMNDADKIHFLLIGRAGMDFYADPPGAKVESSDRFFASLGGSSGNIAAGIAKLGGDVSIATCVSDDAVGRFILNELNDYGVDTQYVRMVGGESRSSLAVVETRLEDCESVIYRNNAADFQMTEAQIQQVDFNSFSTLIITGTALACEPSRSATFKAIALARAAGVQVVLDADYRPYSWRSDQEAAEICNKAAALCDIVVGNDDEFAVMADGRNRALGLAQTLANSSAKLVVYKMGEKGSITFSEGESFETGIYRVTALKPTGAGDAFMAAMITSLSAGFTPEQSVQRGSAAAAIVVSRVACAPAMPTTDELEKFILDQTPVRV